MKQLKKKQDQVIKLLLLGAGECGKSTILKQMKILHQNGFSDEEKEMYKGLILQNILQSVQSVCRAMDELDDCQFADEANTALSPRVCALGSTYRPVLDDMKDFKQLWEDEGIQKLVKYRTRDFHLLDSAPYFMGEMAKILQPDYIPNDQDILCCRLATTGIHYTKFTAGDTKNEARTFRMYDVGGQRGERKQWIHCFDNCHAILFVVSLVEYDQVLVEDKTRNRLIESIALFEGIITLPWFDNTSIILFLNKEDLFEEKIKRVPISEFFPEFTGNNDKKAKEEQTEDFNSEHGKKFIQQKFTTKKLPDGKSPNIYPHCTTATNSENFKTVWAVAKHSVLERALADSGLVI